MKDRKVSMSDETNDVFDVNTDDLDAFEAEFHGTKAETVEVKDTEEDVKTGDVDAAVDEPEDKGEEEDKEAPDGETDEPEAKPEKKVNRFQERINELTAKAREAERKLAELEAKQQKEEPVKAPVPSVDDGPAPDSKNEDGSDKYPLGEFDPQYIRDLTRHTIQTEQAAAREQQERERLENRNKEAREAIQSQWVEKLETVTEKYDDFLDKTIELESAFDGLDSGYSDYLVQTIKSLDHGPEVLYYFANNLDEASKIVRSGPLGATLALGEINAMFKGQTRKTPKVSEAPPPPQVNRGANIRKTVSGDTDDLDSFAQLFFKKK